jgi:hypothetical protein
MAIYQTGGYQVKASAVDKVKPAIRDFVRYVEENEPVRRCIWLGNRRMIRRAFCTSSFLRMLLRKRDMVSQMP